jgi:hypothetical protein
VGPTLDKAISWATDGGELGLILGGGMALLRRLFAWLTDASFQWTQGVMNEALILAGFWALVGAIAGFLLYFPWSVGH